MKKFLRLAYWRVRYFISSRVNGMPYFHSPDGKPIGEMTIDEKANHFKFLALAVEGAFGG